MRDQAIEIAGKETDNQAKRNRLREYLQHVLLRQLFERDLLDELAFHGGTALRIVHDLGRFSEDLDFHLLRPDREYDLTGCLDPLHKDLERSGYQVSLKSHLKGAVQSCMFGFERLLYECGLSGHPSQKLNIKLEIDVNPAQGFHCETKLIHSYFPYIVLHHDKPSFLAGKLHAVLQRPFTKGRDFFDLLFFLSRWKDVSPNVVYLNNALRQTGYRGGTVTERNWKRKIAGVVKEVGWRQIEGDVDAFLIRPADAKAFRKEFLLELLEA